MSRLNQNGYTVTELVISLSVTALLITIVFSFMTNGLADYSTNIKRSELLNSAQVGFDVVTNDIRLSANADTNNRWPDTYAPANEYGWESDSDTLVLARAAETSDGSIIFSDQSQYISFKNNVVYYLQDGQLLKRTIAGETEGNTAKTTCPPQVATSNCPPDSVVLDNIIGLDFFYRDEQNNIVDPAEARSVEMDARLQEETFGRTVTVRYSTRMVFRND